MSAQAKELFSMYESGAQLESRVARIESDISHIESNVALIQIDLRDLRKTTDNGFERVYAKMDAMTVQFDAKLAAMNDHFGEKFKKVDERFEKIDDRFDKVDAKFVQVDERLNAMSDKIDSRFNELVEKMGEQKVWTLTVIGGGILSIIAHALHWL